MIFPRYCQDSAPDVTTSSKTLKVVFTSNKKTVARGAVCTAQCAYTAAGPPAPGPTGMLCGEIVCSLLCLSFTLLLLSIRVSLNATRCSKLLCELHVASYIL